MIRWRLTPWLLLITAAVTFAAALNKDEPTIVLIPAMNLWNEIEKDFQLPTNNENAVVVFGTPESKKSSFIRYVTGVQSTESESIGVPFTVPTFFMDEENVAWYDFPDVTETKNLSIDIVKSNLLKKTVEHTENTKFVFVVNEASLHKQADNYADFDKVFKLAVQLFKNIDADKVSVALIVSQVDPSQSEQQVVDSVIEFLNSYKASLKTSENAYKFLDAQQATFKDGIGIFWRTEEASDQKQKLRKLVNENIGSFNAVSSPFDYHLSVEMENDISALISELKRNITDSIKLIGDAIDEFYHNELTDENKILLNKTHQVLSEFANQNDKLKEPEFLISLKKLVRDQAIYIDRKEFENIAKQQKFLNFLDIAILNRIEIPSSAESFTLQQFSILNKFESDDGELTFLSDLVQAKAKNEKDWTVFKRDLFDELMSYKYQSNRDLYNVADISDWGKPNSTQGIHITKDNLKQFLNHFTFAKTLNDDIWTEKRIKELNNIVFLCLKPQKNDCQQGDIKLTGEFFALSDINPCKNSALERHIKVTIFALDTVVLDKDLTLLNVTQMSIFSYQWLIRRGSSIALKGHSPATEKGFGDRVKDWWRDKLRGSDRKGTKVHPAGEDGSAGRPGGNGGNFFGLIRELPSDNSLSLWSEGGNGGKGENGAQAYPPIPLKGGRKEDASCTDNGQREIADAQYLGKTVSIGETKKDYQEHRSSWDIFLTIQETVWTTEYRLGGSCCASDGLAGRGGKGGFAGKILINIFDENKKECLSITTTNGTIGRNGKNVVPCKAVIQDVTYKKQFTKWSRNALYPAGESTETACKWEIKSTIENPECPRVNEYTDYSNKGVKEPTPLPSIDLETLIDYKMYLIDNMDGNEHIRNLREFYNEIDANLNSSEIISLYTVSTLIKSLKGLEERFFLKKDTFEFLSSYRNLLARIDSYSKIMELSSTTSDKKVLTLLYTTTLSKIYSLESERDLALIIDIKAYLPKVEKNIKKLEEIERQKIVQDNTEKYRAEVSAKITEANNFIQNKVLPLFNKYYKMLDEQMEKFVKEILENKKKTEEEIKKLEKKKELLRKNLEARKALGILNTIGQIVCLAGPYGQVAQAVISTGTTISGSHIVDPGETPSKTIQIPPDLSEILDNLDAVVKARKQKKIDAIKSELENLKNKVKNGIDSATTEQIDALVAELERERDSPDADTTKIDEISNKIIDYVDRRGKELDEAKDSKLAKSFEYAGKALKIIGKVVEAYNQVQNDEKKIDAVSEEIKKSEKIYERYQKLEKEVFNTLVPMLSMVRNDLKKIQNGLTAQSHVALDVARWNVQGTLRTTKTVMAKFVQGFKVEPSITESFQSIDDAFMLLINIYERIQNYQDQEKLVSYIGSVILPGFGNVQVEEPLKSAVIDLKQIMASNIVLSQYLRAVNAFKQVIFPFAGLYLNEYVLPPQLKPEKNLPALIDSAVHRVNALNEVIQSNSSEINKHDRYTFSGRFESNNPALGPFYVWNRKEYGKYIDDFLSGEKVYLRADITKGIDLNAVKFNKIGIEFRSDNLELTEELRLALNSSYITLMHSGVSFYQCDNKFYKITHEVLDINYSYVKKANGDPEVPNGTYQKLEGGNMAVSPYTLWGLQIEGGKGLDLSAFKGQFDLELYGVGQFVKPNNNICKTNLDQFYALDRDVFEFSHVN